MTKLSDLAIFGVAITLRGVSHYMVRYRALVEQRGDREYGIHKRTVTANG